MRTVIRAAGALVSLLVCFAPLPAPAGADGATAGIPAAWECLPLPGEGCVARLLLPLANGHLLVTGECNQPGVYEPPAAFAFLLEPQGRIPRPVMPAEPTNLVLDTGTALPDGGAILAGSTDYFGMEDERNPEIVLLRLNAAGNMLWEKRPPMPLPRAQAGSLLLLPDGTLLLTGAILTGAGRQGFLAGLDFDGNVLWSAIHDTPLSSAALDAPRKRIVAASALRADTAEPVTQVREFSYRGEAGRRVAHAGGLEVFADPFRPGTFFLSGMVRHDGRERPVFFPLNADLSAGPSIFPESATHGYLTSFVRDTPGSILAFAPGSTREESPGPAILRLRLDGSLISRTPVDDPWPHVFAAGADGAVFAAGHKDGPVFKQDFVWIARLLIP